MRSNILLICNWEHHFSFRCNIRFPSTSIRLFFQSLIEDHALLDRVDLPSPSSLGFGAGQGAGGSDDSMDVDRLGLKRICLLL